MTLSVSSAPSAEPVSTAEAKTHLRVTGTDDDTYIDTLVKAARLSIEVQTGRALITQTLKVTLDRFPRERYLELPRPPLASVSSVAYVDPNGVNQTFAAASYTVDTLSQPGRIVLNETYNWPDTSLVANAVTITFIAGYGAAGTAVPADLLLAMKLLIGHWYSNREVASGAAASAELPKMFDYLLWPYKVVWIK
ncbi:conserved hypothetical protein [Gammaproteobacteria bacterium]